MNKFAFYTWLFVAAFNMSSIGFAKESERPYKLGDGAQYQVSTQVGPAEVSIYFVPSASPTDMAVEFYFNTKQSFVPIQLWQQFHLSTNKSGKSGLKMKKGFIFSDAFGNRELGHEYLQGYEGVQLQQFLISSKEDLKKHWIGKETVSVPAGKVQADHYRMENNGQTVDFWIHHSSKPIGLVKLISKGPKASQQYEMKLNSLLKNVKRKIDPAKSQPMDEKTQSYLPSLGPALNLR